MENQKPRRSQATGKSPDAVGKVYDVSLSTMWAKKNFPLLGDFFLAARRLGITKVELNHQVDSGMLVDVDLSKIEISSIHEPCPADISVETLKQRDWMISSSMKIAGSRGWQPSGAASSWRRSLSVGTVVVHAGHVSLDTTLGEETAPTFSSWPEGILRVPGNKELDAGRTSQTFRPSFGSSGEKPEGIIGLPVGLASAWDWKTGTTISIFRRQDEMSVLLALADPDQLGFIYDVGHATVNDRLGFFPNEMWLKRFGGRMLGTHLHDVIGITDHHAPGLGDVDFRKVAGYLPKQAFRTIEVMSFNTPEQVMAGLTRLVDAGCVTLI